MITKTEWMVLNRGLDARAVYGMDMDTGLMDASDFDQLVSDTKAEMQEKLLFDMDGNLTLPGFLLMRNLEFYKQSKRYITINGHTTIGIQEGDEACVLIRKDGDYRLKRMYKADILSLLQSSFPMFTNGIPQHGYTETVTSNAMITRLLRARANLFHIYVDNPKIDRTYFEENNQCFAYDPTKHIAQKDTGTHLLKTVEDLLMMGEGNHGGHHKD